MNQEEMIELLRLRKELDPEALDMVAMTEEQAALIEGVSINACPCGSGLPKEAASDARGIFIAYVCGACEEERLSGYRPEVLSDPNYECDEAIEPEGDW